jgi:hypothetical protein
VVRKTVAFDILEDILAFLYANGEQPNHEDELLNQERDEEMNDECDGDE